MPFSSPRALRGRAVAAGLVLAVAAAPATAHDFWLEPSTFAPSAGQRLTVRLRVGQSFVGDPVPRDETAIVRFVTVGSEGEEPVFGIPGRDPAGLLVARGRATLVVAYVSDGGVNALSPEKLALYVQEEGLESQLPPALLGRSVRDRFARSAKALLAIEGDDRSGFDRVLGLPLELVPLVDPGGLVDGGALSIRLLSAGRPVAGVRVAAISRRDPAHPIAGRTDDAGEVTLGLDAGGRWLIKAVTVRAAEPSTGVDLESSWASLVFETAPGQQ